MSFLQQKFLWLAVLVSFSGAAPVAQAFDLSDYFRFNLSQSDAGNGELPNGLQCMGQQNTPLSIMNAVVLNWKVSTQDQWQSRALVQGPITVIYPGKNGHTHFAINLNNDARGDLEVIYNDEFGELPSLNVGMSVTACGDYITVGPHAHLPSPMGAIIHWVHYNPGDRDGGKHPGGFLIINNKPYGIGPTAIRHR